MPTTHQQIMPTYIITQKYGQLTQHAQRHIFIIKREFTFAITFL